MIIIKNKRRRKKHQQMYEMFQYTQLPHKNDVYSLTSLSHYDVVWESTHNEGEEKRVRTIKFIIRFCKWRNIYLYVCMNHAWACHQHTYMSEHMCVFTHMHIYEYMHIDELSYHSLTHLSYNLFMSKHKCMFTLMHIYTYALKWNINTIIKRKSKVYAFLQLFSLCLWNLHEFLGVFQLCLYTQICNLAFMEKI
jgi:hypothetical protein